MSAMLANLELGAAILALAAVVTLPLWLTVAFERRLDRRR